MIGLTEKEQNEVTKKLQNLYKRDPYAFKEKFDKLSKMRAKQSFICRNLQHAKQHGLEPCEGEESLFDEVHIDRYRTFIKMGIMEEIKHEALSKAPTKAQIKTLEKSRLKAQARAKSKAEDEAKIRAEFRAQVEAEDRAESEAGTEAEAEAGAEAED